MAELKAADLPYRPCAGVVLIDRAGLVFAGCRLDGSGEWQMPQGGIDKGETPRNAALRELAEEIGTDKGEIIAETSDWLTYDLPEHLIGKALKGRYRGQTQKWFAMRFSGADSDINVQGVEHPEFSDWTWMRADDLASQIVTFKRDVYARVFEEFQSYLAQSGR